MPADWSRDAPDLMVAVDRTGIPLALQLQEQLRVAIREGRRPVGEGLPSTGRWPRPRGASRGAVVELYGRLGGEGYGAPGVGRGPRGARSPGGDRRDPAGAPP